MPKIFLRNHLSSEQCRCDAHGGIAYFLQYVKLSKCNMDWDTEKVVCPRCKALLQPPQSLLLFSAFLFAMVNMLVDIINSLIDPRIVLE